MRCQSLTKRSAWEGGGKGALALLGCCEGWEKQCKQVWRGLDENRWVFPVNLGRTMAHGAGSKMSRSTVTLVDAHLKIGERDTISSQLYGALARGNGLARINCSCGNLLPTHHNSRARTWGTSRAMSRRFPEAPSREVFLDCLQKTCGPLPPQRAPPSVAFGLLSPQGLLTPNPWVNPIGYSNFAWFLKGNEKDTQTHVWGRQEKTPPTGCSVCAVSCAWVTVRQALNLIFSQDAHLTTGQSCFASTWTFLHPRQISDGPPSNPVRERGLPRSRRPVDRSTGRPVDRSTGPVFRSGPGGSGPPHAGRLSGWPAAFQKARTV